MVYLYYIKYNYMYSLNILNKLVKIIIKLNMIHIPNHLFLTILNCNFKNTNLLIYVIKILVNMINKKMVNLHRLNNKNYKINIDLIK